MGAKAVIRSDFGSNKYGIDIFNFNLFPGYVKMNQSLSEAKRLKDNLAVLFVCAQSKYGPKSKNGNTSEFREIFTKSVMHLKTATFSDREDYYFNDYFIGVTLSQIIVYDKVSGKPLLCLGDLGDAYDTVLEIIGFKGFHAIKKKDRKEPKSEPIKSGEEIESKDHISEKTELSKEAAVEIVPIKEIKIAKIRDGFSFKFDQIKAGVKLTHDGLKIPMIKYRIRNIGEEELKADNLSMWYDFINLKTKTFVSSHETTARNLFHSLKSGYASVEEEIYSRELWDTLKENQGVMDCKIKVTVGFGYNRKENIQFEAIFDLSNLNALPIIDK